VLLVADDPANLLALGALLSGPEQTLVTARSGEEALDRLACADFAVALLDIRLPGMSGFETARRRRAQGHLTPVALRTAPEASDFSAEDAYALGAVDLLVRPVKPVVLRAKVKGFADLHRRQARVEEELDVSRITRGRIQLRRQRLDLGRLVRTAVGDYRVA